MAYYIYRNLITGRFASARDAMFDVEVVRERVLTHEEKEEITINDIEELDQIYEDYDDSDLIAEEFHATGDTGRSKR